MLQLATVQSVNATGVLLLLLQILQHVVRCDLHMTPKHPLACKGTWSEVCTAVLKDSYASMAGLHCLYELGVLVVASVIIIAPCLHALSTAAWSVCTPQTATQSGEEWSHCYMQAIRHRCCKQ